jgi:hypothetical protein
MATDRSNIVTLLQRVVDLLVRLIGDKIELTARQLRGSAEELGQRATVGIAGALAIAVGAALVALAAAEALAPLLPSRAARLLVVAAPFLIAGAVALRRARSSQGRIAGAATDQTDGHRDQRQHQQHVDPRAERIAADHPE